MKTKAIFLALATLMLSPTLALAEVKLSKSGICHGPQSSYYEQTKNYTPYPDIASCLEVGRLPKGQSTQSQSSFQNQASTRIGTSSNRPIEGPPTREGIPPYDRDAFGGWADFNGDCANTRAEILAAQSTSTITYRSSGCSVDRGRWNDPYTGKIFFEASDVDIDHVVPLAYAWSRGAWAWSAQDKIRFANDPVNLIAVDAPTNRQKGAAGPTEWLPPNARYHCEYVLRFKRISQSYKLNISSAESQKLDEIQARVCR